MVQPGNPPGLRIEDACPAGSGGCSKLPFTNRFGPAAAVAVGSGSTWRMAEAEPKLQPAEITTGVGEVTESVVITNVALLAPAGTTAVAGTAAAAGLLDVRLMASPD